jgi:hypothetical protein
VSTPYADLALLGAYLARRDPPGLTADDPVDVLVLCGSAVLPSFDVAAAAVREGAAARIVVTGGIGHSTPYLYAAVAGHPTYADVPTAGRAEAAIIEEILVRHHRVPVSLVSTEEESTHCGQNAELSLRLLASEPEAPRTIAVVQDPTMQRRTHASFEHWAAEWPGADRPAIRSHAPFVPVVDAGGAGEAHGRPSWTLDRFRDLVLGEIRRLTDDADGYGPRGTGFIGHVDIPDAVVAAAERLRRSQPAVDRDQARDQTL